MDTDRLRVETRPEHEAVEARMPLMDAGLTRQQYIGVLQCMYRAVRPWEDWAAFHAPPQFAGLVRDRRRAHWIEADLLFLGAEAPSAVSTSSLEEMFAASMANVEATESFAAAFLGAMYVVEGSTLGGQYIARHVEDILELEPGVGDGYFRGYGEQTGANWRTFKALLQAVPDEHAATVIASAKAMFAFFGEALEPCAAALTGAALSA